jgi:hypothetical protein
MRKMAQKRHQLALDPSLSILPSFPPSHYDCEMGHGHPTACPTSSNIPHYVVF